VLPEPAIEFHALGHLHGEEGRDRVEGVERGPGFVAFEIARRHRFVRELAAVPEGVAVHVLPTGDPAPGRYNDLAQLRFRDFSRVDRRIAFAYAATAEYLDSRS
jgi:hypothetical protein